MVVIFGVIMGIPLFGFWGIIFGPLLISTFLLLIRLYYMEFRLMTPSERKMEIAEDNHMNTVHTHTQEAKKHESEIRHIEDGVNKITKSKKKGKF